MLTLGLGQVTWHNELVASEEGQGGQSRGYFWRLFLAQSTVHLVVFYDLKICKSYSAKYDHALHAQVQINPNFFTMTIVNISSI